MVKPKQLGHLVLGVRDLDRSERFYTEVLGLEVTSKIPGTAVFLTSNHAAHELALRPVGPDAPGPEKSRVGLYHFAWEMESFEDLKTMYADLKEKGVPIGAVEDHGISIGLYIHDPDSNQMEFFYELPRDQWPKEGDIFEGNFPWSLEDEAIPEPA